MALQQEATDADEKLKRLYRLVEDGLTDLALLWQIYSRCFSSLIQDRQYGHR